MKTIFLDILHHTADVGLFDVVKIQGTENETLIFSTDKDKTVILNGKTKEPQPELIGVFGLNNLKYLKGINNHSLMKDNPIIQIEYKGTGENKVPENISYQSSSDKETNQIKLYYRLMHESTIPSMGALKKTVDWNVVFEPKKEKIQQFAETASLYADIEERFYINVVDKKLVFYLGEEKAATHKGSMIFETDLVVNKKFNSPMAWNIGNFLQISKLAENAGSTIKIADVGVINFEINSGNAIYNYYLMAEQR